MTSLTISRRYAKALFDLAKKDGVNNFEEIQKYLLSIQEAIKADSRLHVVFTSPIFTSLEKQNVLNDLLEKLECSPTIKNFFKILVEKNRFLILDSIIKSYEQLIDEEKNIVRGTLFTAIPLDKVHQQEILNNLTKQLNKNLVLDFDVSPNILGGVLLKIGDYVMDASLKAQLSILKDSIKRGDQNYAH